MEVIEAMVDPTVAKELVAENLDPDWILITPTLAGS